MLTRVPHDVRIHTIAYLPGSQTDHWIETRTTRYLRQLPDTRIHLDRDGLICRQFGVSISGHMLGYDGRGKLICSGGITPYRGHEGESRAAEDFVAKVTGTSAACAHWPVYGCSLVNTEENMHARR